MPNDGIRSNVPIYIVDAFTPRAFGGNPAAVVLFDEWPPDDCLQSIAAEVNLSETAFLVQRQLRWFTPRIEVGLCGHATMATAHVLAFHLGTTENPIAFETQSGQLSVRRQGKDYVLDFPARTAAIADTPIAELEAALRERVKDVLVAHDRYICFLDSADQVARLSPDFSAVAALPLAGVVVTAPGDGTIDFVSRYFAPAKGVPEDPVTGTSHCVLAPLWGVRLGKTVMHARQLSQRGGNVVCELEGERVLLRGQATTFSVGNIQARVLASLGKL